MIQWLVKSTNEYRIETLEEVEAFHKFLQNKAEQEGYQLSAFSWNEKQIKESGEIVDVYYQVKATNIFNTLKSPENPFMDVEFPKREYTNEGEF